MSRRALIRKSISQIKLALGQFDDLKLIDDVRIDRLVFVCRGNVCRSPYGEAAAISLGLSAISCGVEVTRSDPAEEMALKAAYLRGKDLSHHMSRSIFDLHLEQTDCLVALDQTHLTVSRKVADRFGCQITLLGLWRNTPVPEIADPYGKSLETFSACFDEIDEALSRLVLLL